MAHFGKKKVRRAAAGPASEVDRAEFVKKIRAAVEVKDAEYRRQSLSIHPWVCAKCGRAFEESNLSLLTVHHRDGNHHNNPPDGSNWENLCVYCHEDEHARGILADYVADVPGGGPDPDPEPKPSGGFGTFAAALARRQDGGK